MIERHSIRPRVTNSHDFTGSLEDWEDRVFLDATQFRLHRYFGKRGHDEAGFTNFAECVSIARALASVYRVLIYAVTPAGRSFAVERKRWDHFLTLWNKHPGNPGGFQPS